MSELEEEITRSEMFTSLLHRICDALKGKPESNLVMYSWHDLPEVGLALRMRNEKALQKIREFMADPELADAYNLLCDIEDILEGKA